MNILENIDNMAINALDTTHDPNECTNFQCISCLTKPTPFEMSMKIEYLKIQTAILGHSMIGLGFNLVYDFCDEGNIVYMNYIGLDVPHGLHVVFKQDSKPHRITMYDIGNPIWAITLY